VSDILIGILSNPLFIAAACSWLVAQTAKTVLYFIINHEFCWERIVGAGGMPSAHSATVCALSVSTAFTYGVQGFEFPMTCFFAFIVMYDAMGVRRETGEQAKVLNEIIDQWFNMGNVLQTRTPMENFKEFVGHTPLQVLVGALIGILIGTLVCIC
jgi:uncharacterized protein